MIPATPEFDWYYFKDKLDLINMATMKEKHILEEIEKTNTERNSDWNRYMEIQTGYWKKPSRTIEELREIDAIGKKLAEEEFKQVDLMEIESNSDNLWKWAVEGVKGVVDAVGETGTIICCAVFFGTLMVIMVGCAMKVWGKKSRSPAAQSEV